MLRCMILRKIFFEDSNFEECNGYKNVSEWFTAKCLTGDKSDNVPGIPGYGKVKVNNYLNNNIKLTAQETEIFERNKDIFSLDKYKSIKAEDDYYKQQLAKTVTPDYKVFIAFCEEYNFNRILDNKEKWYSLFFMKSLYNKLDDLFA